MKVKILGARVDALNMKGAVERVLELASRGGTAQVVTLNAEMLYTAQHHAGLLQAINASDLVVPDGAGVVWASRFLGCPLPERVPGIDLVGELAREGGSRGFRFYLFGGRPGVAEEAARNLKARHPGLNIVGAAHGYPSPEEERKLLSDMKAKRPHVLLVALGSPKQELWIRKHLPELGVGVAIGVGGALDVLSGRKRRAPEAFQKAHLEWLYRMAADPRRVLRAGALAGFILLVVKERVILSAGARKGSKVP